MQITALTDNPHRDLVTTLYSAVDNLDAQAIAKLVTRDVRFQLGNFDELRGKPAVIDANNAFFGTISAMRHTIDDIGSEGQTVYCTGSVHYTRQDNSELTIPFATRLKLEGGQIADYRVYVDVSPL
jgi:ketosteroid isomerase-like protein